MYDKKRKESVNVQLAFGTVNSKLDRNSKF